MKSTSMQLRTNIGDHKIRFLFNKFDLLGHQNMRKSNIIQGMLMKEFVSLRRTNHYVHKLPFQQVHAYIHIQLNVQKDLVRDS